MNENAKRSSAFGGGLIALGVGLYFLQFAGGLGRGIFTVLGGGVLVAGYLWSRSLLLLVPGCLLLALGLGSIGQRSFFALDRTNWIPIGIGLVAVTVITGLYEKKPRFWPLLPGGLLILLGFEGAWLRFKELMRGGWPLALVALGAIVVVITLLRQRKSKSSG